MDCCLQTWQASWSLPCIAKCVEGCAGHRSFRLGLECLPVDMHCVSNNLSRSVAVFCLVHSPYLLVPDPVWLQTRLWQRDEEGT